jgi:glycosyltransferase involved in cell wall biosynthesis
MKVSVVIPVHGEEGIATLLDDLLSRPDAGNAEFIVVDGAPSRDTLDRVRADQAADPRVVLLASPPGRGVQQNAGARAAGGDILLFLLVRQSLASPYLAGGAFSLRYAEPSPGLSFIAAAANRRSNFTRVPYGDQAIFVRRDIFHGLGGFRPLPIMEDLDFMTRLRRAGHAIRILAMPVCTSGRRQLREGLVRCTLRNLLLRLLFHCGVPAGFLAGFYRRHRG